MVVQDLNSLIKRMEASSAMAVSLTSPLNPCYSISPQTMTSTQRPALRSHQSNLQHSMQRPPKGPQLTGSHAARDQPGPLPRYMSNTQVRPRS